MRCNVCGTDARCYQLREVNGHPGMMMRGEGMIFTICSACLSKLMSAIKTDATAIETPEQTPISDRIAQMNARSIGVHLAAINAAHSKEKP
jgi:hypothetical protein